MRVLGLPPNSRSASQWQTRLDNSPSQYPLRLEDPTAAPFGPDAAVYDNPTYPRGTANLGFVSTVLLLGTLAVAGVTQTVLREPLVLNKASVAQPNVGYVQGRLPSSIPQAVAPAPFKPAIEPAIVLRKNGQVDLVNAGSSWVLRHAAPRPFTGHPTVQLETRRPLPDTVSLPNLVLQATTPVALPLARGYDNSYARAIQFPAQPQTWRVFGPTATVSVAPFFSNLSAFDTPLPTRGLIEAAKGIGVNSILPKGLTVVPAPFEGYTDVRISYRPYAQVEQQPSRLVLAVVPSDPLPLSRGFDNSYRRVQIPPQQPVIFRPSPDAGAPSEPPASLDFLLGIGRTFDIPRAPAGRLQVEYPNLLESTLAPTLVAFSDHENPIRVVCPPQSFQDNGSFVLRTAVPPQALPIARGYDNAYPRKLIPPQQPTVFRPSPDAGAPPPSGGVVDFLLQQAKDFPNPQRPLPRQGFEYTNLLTSTLAPTPVAFSDHENPWGARRGRQDWIQGSPRVLLSSGPQTYYVNASTTGTGTVTLNKAVTYQVASSTTGTGSVTLVKLIQMAFSSVGTGTASLVKQVNKFFSTTGTGTASLTTQLPINQDASIVSVGSVSLTTNTIFGNIANLLRSSINDLMYWALGNYGFTGSLHDRLWKFYQDNSTRLDGALPEMEYDFLKSQGVADGALEDMWDRFLRLKGFSDGSIADRKKAYWAAGGPV